MNEQDNILKADVQKIVRDELQKNFTLKKIGDTPTDANQLVPKQYFITGGDGSIMGASSLMSIDPNKGRLFTITENSSVTTVTVNASVAGVYGQQIQFLIGNDSAAARTTVFASLFSSTSVVGLRSSVATISFVSNGAKFYPTALMQGL